MVSVVEIITEGEIDDLMVGNMASRQTWNGITARFAGNAWMVEEMTPEARTNYPKVRPNQPLPRALRGNFINLARRAVGYPPVTFSSTGEVRGPINNNPLGGPSTTNDRGTIRPTDTDLRADPNDRIGATPQGQNPRVPMADITDINDSRLVGTDELTTAQKRELRNNGRVVIGQLTYFPEDIAEADRRFTRHLNTTSQTSLAKMSGEKSVQAQARANLRLLSTQMAGRIIRRTFIPVVFSPTANVAAVIQMRNMLIRKNEQVLDDPNYTAEMYDQDVQRVMGAWWLATLGPIVGSGIKGTYRLSSAAMNALFNRAKRVIDATNGTPRVPGSKNPKRWVVYIWRRFVDFVKTEASAAALVTFVGKWPWAQEWFLWLLSLAYISDVVELTGVTGDALETIIRRGFPDMWGGADTWDSMQDYIQDELGLQIDAPLTVDMDGDGQPTVITPGKVTDIPSEDDI